jgi:hypothetical protein
MKSIASIITGMVLVLFSTSALAFDSVELKAKAEKKKGETLVFKSFYLGMPISDAQALLNHYCKLEQTSSTPVDPQKHVEKANGKAAKNQPIPEDDLAMELLEGLLGGNKESTEPFRIFKQGEYLAIQRNARERPFAVADSKGNVFEFELSEAVRNKIFDSSDTPVKAFLQSFIEAYGIPTLDPSRVKLQAKILGLTKDSGFQNILQFRSDKGFEVTYWDEPTLWEKSDALHIDTSPGGCLTVKSVKTGKELKASFD